MNSFISEIYHRIHLYQAKNWCAKPTGIQLGKNEMYEFEKLALFDLKFSSNYLEKSFCGLKIFPCKRENYIRILPVRKNSRKYKWRPEMD